MPQEPESANSRKKLTKLTHDQHYLLRKWMEENRSRISKLSRPRIAEVAVSELGFPISDSSVSGLFTSLGWVAAKPAKPVDPMESVLARLDALEDAVKRLQRGGDGQLPL